jgi:hypothetical protein
MSTPINLDDHRKKKAAADVPAVQPMEVVDRLNKLHAVVTIGGKTSIMTERTSVHDQRRIDRTFSTRKDLELQYANDLHVVGVRNGKEIVQSADAIWIKSPQRRSYTELILDPRRAPGGDDEAGLFNLWNGFAFPMGPDFFKPAAAKKWARTRDHILKIVCRGDAKLFRWVCAWIAERLKHPERTAQVALVLMGGEGVGKGSFATNIIGGLYHPQHFVHVIDQEHLLGRFNMHLADGLMVFADEAFFAGDPRTVGRLKGLITESEILLEGKFLAPIRLRNQRAFILASNESLVIPAGIDARRFAVFQLDESHRGDHSYFAAIREELANGGREEMARYLMQEDFSDVNPYQAPQTEALTRQKELNFDPPVRWIFDKLNEGILPQLQAPSVAWSETGETVVEVSAAVTDYLSTGYMRKAHERHVRSAQTVLGIALAQFIPSRKTSRGSFNGCRVQQWVLPKLSTARAEFEKKLGAPYAWEEPMEKRK